MELFTLNSSFQPMDMIENYSSLIWTERYSTNGDFVLESSDIAGVLATMPKEHYVGLRESTVPMIIEDHKITKDPRNAPKITVTGRSLDSALERRQSVNTLASGAARAVWTISAAKASDAVYKAIRVVLGDVARTRTTDQQPLASEVAMGASVLPSVAPAVSILDAIPEFDLILPTDYSSLTPYSYEIEAGNLYETVVKMLQTNHHGMRAIRPSSSGSTVAIEIYNGADLTSDLQFDARFDQFDSSTYLFSARGSTNVAYVYGSNGSTQVLKNAVDVDHPEPSGLSRRVLLVDEQGDATLNTAAIRSSRGLVELYKYNVTAMFDGEISVQVAAGFNNEYFLGDILLLVGEYGLSERVRVAEFIRSSDASGEKAYPTLELVDG